MWGFLYIVKGEERIRKAIEVTHKREMTLGGYKEEVTEFYHRDNADQPEKVTVYIATPDNALFNREDDLEKLAEQIVQAEGSKGPNSDYVLKLEEENTKHFPKDDYLCKLAQRVKSLSK